MASQRQLDFLQILEDVMPMIQKASFTFVLVGSLRLPGISPVAFGLALLDIRPG